MRRCPECHKKTELFFCPECGCVIEYPSFIQGNERLCTHLDEYVRQYVAGAHALRQNVDDESGHSKLADAVVQSYMAHVRYLKELCGTAKVKKAFSKSGADLFQDMDNFAKRCMANECQVAVVGTIKAGKSMFINAFLGKEIASVHPTPETATLTKFRYSPDGNYVRVSFYTEEEWERLWNDVMAASKRTARDDKEDFLSEYSQLKADEVKGRYIGKDDLSVAAASFEELKHTVEMFTSAKYPDHYFAKEVEIGLNEFNVPLNVVFVDTPGLNDPVGFRTDITKKYLHSASVVLLCLRSITAEITSSELNDISELFSLMRYNKERIFILGTQFDVQPDYFNFWENVRLPHLLQWLSGKEYFGSMKEAKSRIFPVSAWYYILIQRLRNDRSLWDDEEMCSHHLNKMLDSSVKYTEWTALRKKYGLEEAERRYKERETLFNENIGLLEENTNVPAIREAILRGPVRNAGQIILQDVIGEYTSLARQISEVSDNVILSDKTAIELSEQSDIPQRIAEIDKVIVSNAALLDNRIKVVANALSELDSISRNCVESLNDQL